MIAGKHFAGTAKARSNLIANEQYIIAIAQGPELLQIKCRIDAHARTALQQWFDNHRCRFLRMFRKRLLRFFEAFTAALLTLLPIRTAITVRRLDMDIIHHHRLVHFRIKIHTAYR